jgi:hypothetical protein
MSHFRSIALIIAVLLQALPGVVGLRAMGMPAEPAPSCEMECCAWIQELEQEQNTCACSPASQEQSPATSPTIPSQSTRDVIPVVYWKAQEDVLQSQAPVSQPQSGLVMADASEKATPHVRLPVLFCAILI